MRKLFVAVALTALIGVAATSCHPRMMGTVIAAAIITAAIVGSAQALSYHDGHYHHEYCGHGRRHHQGRWVYQYEGRWEYYDQYDGRWYYYR